MKSIKRAIVFKKKVKKVKKELLVQEEKEIIPIEKFPRFITIIITDG
ncbi:MAG: hypothetical protein GX682_03555 [Clostridiaceae bacterium]|nr:hypothetical protein [Clostridiaceae bacterium]